MSNNKKINSRQIGITIGVIVILIWALMGQKYFGLPNAITLEHARNGILTLEDIQQWLIVIIMFGGLITFYYVPTKSCSDNVKADIEKLQQKESNLSEKEKQDLAFHRFYDFMNRLGHSILLCGFLALLIVTILRVVF